MKPQPSRARHRLLASLAAATAVGAALSVHAVYSSTSSSQDIMKSCKDFSVSGSGVLTATCNVWSSQGTVHRQDQHTIDLDDKVGFDGSALKYNQTGYSGKCDDEAIVVDNVQILLTARCPSDAQTIHIRIDDMIYNHGGEVGAGDVGLYWRAARGSLDAQS